MIARYRIGRNTLRSADVEVGPIDAPIANLAIAGGDTLLTTDIDFRAGSSQTGLWLWRAP